MKQSELLRRIVRAARDAEVEFVFVRHGGNHDVYSYGGRRVVIPRHREIPERTAESVLKQLDIR